MSGPSIDPRDLRVSDDERAHVMNVLEKATGRGLIDLGEFNERSAAAVVARTRGDLNRLLLDLPGLQVAGHTVQEARAATAPTGGPVPGFSGAPAAAHRSETGNAAPPLELTGWGSRSFKGGWSVPSHIVIGGMGASTKLDFSTAVLTSRTVVVEFRSNSGGAAEFVVPEGTSVRFEGLQMRGGHFQNKVPTGGGGVLELILTGVKKNGSITVRHPKKAWFG